MEIRTSIRQEGPTRESCVMAPKARQKLNSNLVARCVQPAPTSSWLVFQVIAEFAVGALQRLKTKLVSCPKLVGRAGFMESGAGFSIEV